MGAEMTPGDNGHQDMVRRSGLAIVMVLAWLIGWPASSAAQTAPAATVQSGDYQADYDNLPQFGGPDGVAPQLEQQDRKAESAYPSAFLQRSLKPWFDWKRELNEKHGFTLGASLYLLYQKADQTIGSKDDALGSIFRLQGKWTLFDRGGSHPGGIEWRIENRSNLGGKLSPSQLGGEVGAAALNTGFAYAHDFSTDLAVFNWTQLFADERAGVAAGRLSFDVYLDAFAFQTFSRGFLNRAFLVNPTLATTGIGSLGAVGKGFLSEQVWVGAHIYDANAVSGEFDINTVEEGEWLKALEVAWTPARARAKTDRVQFTFWDKDARQKAGVPAGQGWAVSASWQVTEALLPFVRFGHSDGGGGVVAKNAASIGFELATRPWQAWTFGAGWAEPTGTAANGRAKRDEYVLETSYKFQLSPNFSLLPDLQLLIDPANQPSESTVLIGGLRGILTL